MRTVSFIFLLLLSCTGIAQHYHLVVSKTPYADITNPTYEIPDTSQYFGNVTVRPDMFMQAFGRSYDLYDGVMIPIKQGYGYFLNSSRSVTVYVAKGEFGARPGTGEMSMFSFVTEGSAGSRIFTAQWKNMGFERGDSTDYINFQMRLYEQSGSIEFHFGSSYVKPGLWEQNANGPTIGLLEMNAAFSTIYSHLWLTGQANAPGIDSITQFVQLNDVPPAGTLYRFVNGPVGTEEIQSRSTSFNAYPNPTTGSVRITGVGPVSIYDLVGKKVHEFQRTDTSEPLDLSFLPAGTYFLHSADLRQKIMICK